MQNFGNPARKACTKLFGDSILGEVKLFNEFYRQNFAKPAHTARRNFFGTAFLGEQKVFEIDFFGGQIFFREGHFLQGVANFSLGGANRWGIGPPG